MEPISYPVWKPVEEKKGHRKPGRQNSESQRKVRSHGNGSQILLQEVTSQLPEDWPLLPMHYNSVAHKVDIAKFLQPLFFNTAAHYGSIAQLLSTMSNSTPTNSNNCSFVIHSGAVKIVGTEVAEIPDFYVEVYGKVSSPCPTAETLPIVNLHGNGDHNIAESSTNNHAPTPSSPFELDFSIPFLLPPFLHFM